jgi:hypothetical protein
VLLGRLGPAGGRLRVTIDGRPLTTQDEPGGAGSVSLRAAQPGSGEVPVVAGLSPGPHTLELTAADSGEVALAGIVVASERPDGWVWPWLHGAALAIVVLGVWALLWLGWRAAGARLTLARPSRWRPHAH